MKASELRIGNLILGARGYVKVSAILESGLIRIEGNSSFFGVEGSEPCLLPIPLTEEWLVKFGFDVTESFNDGEKVDYQYELFFNIEYITERVFHYDTDEDGVTVSFGVREIWDNEDLMDSRSWIVKNIKYVHQLQNLYFALTGEELTIK